MTGTPIYQDIVTRGIEHNVTPGGSLGGINNWANVIFDDLPKSIVLNGFRVYSRYYVETCTYTGVDDPISGEPVYSCSREYPSWLVTNQTLEKISPSRRVFTTDNGDELFVTDLGPDGMGMLYGTTEAGIKDGTKYGYVNVFDEADISYWPRASTNSQPIVDDPTHFPDDDEKYLMDTLTSFLPDGRDQVVITYRLTTTYNAEGASNSDTLLIYHVVEQDPGDVAGKINSYLARSYYSDGKYHVQLHEKDEAPLYNKGGELIRPEAYKTPYYDEYNNLVNSVIPIRPEDVNGMTDEELVKYVTDYVKLYQYPPGTSEE